MKAVLLSTRPKWCEKICHKIGTDKNGKPIYEKSIEARKTKPSIPTPFKAYIYMTKKKPYMLTFAGNGKMRVHNGMVIGEFICDKVDEYKFHNGLTKFNSMGLPSGVYGSYLIFADDYKSMCLSYDEVKNYGKGKTLYGWHISDLKIYDKPKELSEFFDVKYDTVDYCVGCPHHETPVTEYPCCDCVCEAGNRKYLTRPPQSWCYVQE